MFDANLCGVKAGRKVIVRFHGEPMSDGPCPINEGVYEALIINSGESGYESCLIKVRIDENLTIELKDVDVGNRIVSYDGEVE